MAATKPAWRLQLMAAGPAARPALQLEAAREALPALQLATADPPLAPLADTIATHADVSDVSTLGRREDGRQSSLVASARSALASRPCDALRMRVSFFAQRRC